VAHGKIDINNRLGEHITGLISGKTYTIMVWGAFDFNGNDPGHADGGSKCVGFWNSLDKDGYPILLTLNQAYQSETGDSAIHDITIWCNCSGIKSPVH
jgi:hypothetical protein